MDFHALGMRVHEAVSAKAHAAERLRVARDRIEDAEMEANGAFREFEAARNALIALLDEESVAKLESNGAVPGGVPS